jgi:DNA polymerase-3 subunit alpha
MPDIDIDFCMEGRERVLAYTRQRYGSETVAQIVTFGTMASRTVVRDVGRALDIPLSEIDKISKKIPSGPLAPPLAEALEKDPDLKALAKGPARSRRAVPALRFRSKVSRATSRRTPPASSSPTGRSSSTCRSRKNGEDICTQWAAPHLEELGLLKMDYLGLRTLTILERTLRTSRARASPPDLDPLPEATPRRTSSDRGRHARRVPARVRRDEEAARAHQARLLRGSHRLPRALSTGPLESGMVEMFTRRKHGEEAIEYPHPSLEPILRDTYGCIVYQEQVMLISRRLSSFSLNEADNLRKAMGKKKHEIMEKFSEQFVPARRRTAAREDVAREIWENILKFGGYGFNKSHSTAYAVITYQTAF